MLASLTPAIFGQTITGSITGTVVDSTGAVIGGAKVTATNTGTGVASEAPSVKNARPSSLTLQAPGRRS